VEFTPHVMMAIRMATDANVKFGVVPKEHWSVPEWYGKTRLEASMEMMSSMSLLRADQLSYHHMCRFYSGFFYHHPLLSEYEYYWRVEPDARFHCDMNFDPFAFMKRENKVYGFNIALNEDPRTVPGLWSKVEKFRRQHPEYVAPDNFWSYLSNADGGYNLCQFWSNFEIARLDFYRTPAYEALFHYLDRAGGFFDHRWGDAPIHTMAVAMLLRPDQIQYWDDIGYSHTSETHCPRQNLAKRHCDCSNVRAIWQHSCAQRWLSMFGEPKSAWG